MTERNLLITGASRGIGAAAAVLAAKAGWNVAINCRRELGAAEAVAAAVRAEGRRALVVPADVADEAQIGAMFAAVDEQLGPLHGLVNNAGVVDVAARVDEMSADLSSAAARVGSPGLYLDYSMSKAAIDHFTTGLAREVAADGIRVNAVRPGIIDTEIHATSGHAERLAAATPLIPMARLGTADEVAQAIVWLLSDDAAYVSGALLDVSGGR